MNIYKTVWFIGTALEYRKISTRLTVLQMLIFSLIVYQFYSSSIVSGLLRPTFISIDTVQKLEESGLDVGVEDFNILIRMIEVNNDVFQNVNTFEYLYSNNCFYEVMINGKRT